MRTPSLARRSPAWRDVVALMLLALIVYVAHLGTRSLTFDEAGSVLYAHLGLPSFLQALARDPNMSFYYGSLRLWVAIFGESEVAVRSMSVFAAALGVAMVYVLGARLFGRTVGIVAGLLLSLNAFVVRYAQTARSYALLFLLTVVASYVLVEEIERPSRRNRIAYVVVATLAVYTHYFAAYVLAVHAATVVAIERQNALTRAWLTVAAAILLLVVPTVIFASRIGYDASIGWIEPPSLADVRLVAIDLAGGSEMALWILLAGGSYALVSARRRPPWWPHGFVAAWLGVPIALALGASFKKPMFLSYYLIVVAPALALFGATTVEEWRPAAAAAFAVPLLGLLVAQQRVFNRIERFENWREPTTQILASTRPGDAIVFFPDGARRPFEYYERRQGVAEPDSPTRPPRADSSRVWFVIRESDAAGHQAEVAGIRSSLTERYRLADRREFRRIGVELYVR